VIEKVRTDKPDAYLKIVASLLPKDINLNARPLDEVSDDQLLRLAQLTEMAKPLLAKLDTDRDEAEGSLPAMMERPRYQLLVMTRREGSGLARRMSGRE
jgi:hypothetical protein